MALVEPDGLMEHIGGMATQTSKVKKSNSAAKPVRRSFFYHGVKITPMGSGTSRVARAIREGIERRRRDEQVAGDGAPA